MRYRDIERRLAELEEAYQPVVVEVEPEDQEREAWEWAAYKLGHYVSGRGGFRYLTNATAAYNWHQVRQEQNHGYRTDHEALEIVRTVEAICAEFGEAAVRLLPYTAPVFDLLDDARCYLRTDGLYEL